MTNDEWVSDGRSRWKYTDYANDRWNPDIAVITCVGAHYWHLFINTQHIATFDSWAEARDATPMMIALHGYGANK